jgi:hypothetical protein
MATNPKALYLPLNFSCPLSKVDVDQAFQNEARKWTHIKLRDFEVWRVHKTFGRPSAIKAVFETENDAFQALKIIKALRNGVLGQIRFYVPGCSLLKRKPIRRQLGGEPLKGTKCQIWC